MTEDSELVGIEAADGGLLRLRHRRTQPARQLGTRRREGTQDLAPILAPPPGHETSALEAIHEARDPGSPLQQPLGNLKCRKAFRSTIRQDQQHVVLLESHLLDGQVPLDSSPDRVCD